MMRITAGGNNVFMFMALRGKLKMFKMIFLSS